MSSKKGHEGKRVSSAKGGAKTRKPRYQNEYAFTHNLKSKTTKKIMGLKNEGLCKSCHDKIEWKKQYRKYHPLKQPSTCVRCKKKNVLAAYHKACKSCSSKSGARCCPMCLQPKAILKTEEQEQKESKKKLQDLLEQPMKERERRTLVRKLEKVKTGDLVLSTEEDEEGNTTTIFETVAGAEDVEMEDGDKGEGEDDY